MRAQSETAAIRGTGLARGGLRPARMRKNNADMFAPALTPALFLDAGIIERRDLL